jgi:hypothetical protein
MNKAQRLFSPHMALNSRSSKTSVARRLPHLEDKCVVGEDDQTVVEMASETKASFPSIMKVSVSPGVGVLPGDEKKEEEQPPLTQGDVRALSSMPSPAQKVIYGSYYQDFKMFRQFKDEIEKVFVDVQSNKSAALDIIASYLRGQKIIYIESKTHCEQSLYLLMFPTIFISSLLTVLSLALEAAPYGHIIVSGFGALNTFILGLVSYLKLDAKTEAHKTTAYQFDKLQTQCEFYSGKTLFFNDTETIGVVEEVESKVSEIKDNNQFIVPESVRCRFPILYSTNIFTEVKKIGTRENLVKHRLCVVYAALDKLRQENELGDNESVLIMEDMGHCTIENLEAKKNDFMAEYLDIQKDYLDLNAELNKEIGTQLRRSQRSCGLCRWLKT